jgi:hypothetical protein
MKPITWLRKFDKRGDRGYPVATLAFYGPDDKKASRPFLASFLRKAPNHNCKNGSGTRTPWISEQSAR